VPTATTFATFPSLSGTNVRYGTSAYQGPLNNSVTYEFWSESVQTVPMTITWNNNTAATKAVSVQLLGNPTIFAVTVTVPASAANAPSSPFNVTLKQGWNRFFVSSTTGQSNVFPTSVKLG